MLNLKRNIGFKHSVPWEIYSRRFGKLDCLHFLRGKILNQTAALFFGAVAFIVECAVKTFAAE